ncbi:type 1 glutamine amidotransferase domain-containing protein [Streptomyces toxytricini]|uniref:Type 1 glutamine amidotransferase domain-containing protein n=1 Tax=Streptomyces toxytricini TaxID=67369 RepID=A0ABW8EQ13_STRT5
MRIAFLTAPEGVEEIELTQPWKAVLEAGWIPRLVSTEPGDVRAYRHLDKAGRHSVDDVVGEAEDGDGGSGSGSSPAALAAGFDALVLPGGVANPDALRMHGGAVEFVRHFVDAGKPVAAICHAPWTLVEAGAVSGRILTSWPSLATDIRNAGGTWVDEEVHVCRAAPSLLVTSRKPGDLDAFCSALVEEFGGHGNRRG